MPSINDFIQKYGTAAQKAADLTGLSRSEVLGQWGLETGWGTHFAGVNNPGNVSPGGKVANYTTIEQGISAYSNVIKKLGVASIDPIQFAANLQNQGYATDNDYANKVAASIKSVENSLQLPGIVDKAIYGKNAVATTDYSSAPSTDKNILGIPRKLLFSIAIGLVGLNLIFLAIKGGMKNE